MKDMEDMEDMEREAKLRSEGSDLAGTFHPSQAGRLKQHVLLLAATSLAGRVHLFIEALSYPTRFEGRN
jgi:hypothetical protein